MTQAVEHLTSELKDRYRLLSEIARRRGFFWGSFEIYGGLSGFLDLGPLGTGLRREIEDTWREFFLRRHGFVEISTPIITPHRVLEASGHVENFKDPMTECTNCHRRFRADQLIKEATAEETEGLNLDQLASLLAKVKCPSAEGYSVAPNISLPCSRPASVRTERIQPTADPRPPREYSWTSIESTK